ncbi:hypothetical protein PR048_027301 [Dryococelus australis]|uniref:Uncharacterized protein n=1 Tax=Dryococelus australis TaxID=614101 RepID=A0ABQ9GF37_9NEOP|nr:hypothetical protein PR048_027301 [Dryococelus australis]
MTIAISEIRFKRLQERVCLIQTIQERTSVPDKRDLNASKCKKQCFQHFTEYQQIDVIQTINGRPRSGVGSTKASSYIYNVVLHTEKIKVCRDAVAALHGITSKRACRLCTLLSRGKSPTDKRGKHRNGREMPGVELQKVHEHIEFFSSTPDSLLL